jgi:hypothetical protein
MTDPPPGASRPPAKRPSVPDLSRYADLDSHSESERTRTAPPEIRLLDKMATQTRQTSHDTAKARVFTVIHTIYTDPASTSRAEPRREH